MTSKLFNFMVIMIYLMDNYIITNPNEVVPRSQQIKRLDILRTDQENIKLTTRKGIDNSKTLHFENSTIFQNSNLKLQIHTLS